MMEKLGELPFPVIRELVEMYDLEQSKKRNPELSALLDSVRKKHVVLVFITPSGTTFCDILDGGENNDV